jgi:hypothetical protein
MGQEATGRVKNSTEQAAPRTTQAPQPAWPPDTVTTSYHPPGTRPELLHDGLTLLLGHVSMH